MYSVCGIVKARGKVSNQSVSLQCSLSYNASMTHRAYKLVTYLVASMNAANKPLVIMVSVDLKLSALYINVKIKGQHSFFCLMSSSLFVCLSSSLRM